MACSIRDAAPPVLRSRRRRLRRPGESRFFSTIRRFPTRDAGNIGLRDGRAGGLAALRRGDSNIEFTGLPIQTNAVGDGATLTIGGRVERIGAVREGASGALGGQKKDHRGAFHRLARFVTNFDDRHNGDFLVDIVDGAVTFHDRDAQAGLLRGQEIHYEKKNQRGKSKHSSTT